MDPLLKVDNLVVEFNTDKGIARAVDNISFEVNQGETVGIVGESGCGKSVTSLSIIRLIASPPGKIVSGEIKFNGDNLLSKSEHKMRKIRGNDISMIFQEPMTALNPVLTIGHQIMDVLRLHQGKSGNEAEQIAIDLLKQVGIPSSEKRVNEYPHQLSGGMRQRVMIAMALTCNPKLLIADEPTTALDVTIQAQVMNQINKLQQLYKMAVILVTHDLGVIAETCQRVIVMYCGKIVEMAEVNDLFADPLHPYTRGLLTSIPQIRENKLSVLPTIKGMVPDLLALPRGCRFADRCPQVRDKCRQGSPDLVKVEGTRMVACYYPFEKQNTNWRNLQSINKDEAGNQPHTVGF